MDKEQRIKGEKEKLTNTCQTADVLKYSIPGCLEFNTSVANTPIVLNGKLGEIRRVIPFSRNKLRKKECSVLNKK